MNEANASMSCTENAEGPCQQAENDISDPSTCMPSEADKAKQQRLLGEKAGWGACC
jgi:hypothetical protein